MDIIARWHQSINEISQDAWEKLIDHNDIPFFNWYWMKALEESGSISRKNGWQPIHLTLWKNSALIALAPLYLKNHSFGEFIFDQNFVQLAIDLKLDYYPKIIGMSPLSPIEGYRFFCLPDENEEEITEIMMKVIDNFAKQNNILSCNFLYVSPTWEKLAEKAGCCTWINQQTQWSSLSDNNFSDYLSHFNSNQRRNIKRERKSIEKEGVNINIFNGETINAEIMNKMYFFYKNHCKRWGPWGSKYLSKEFFEQINNEKLRDQLVIFSAHREDPKNPVAMSMCIKGKEMLWGRYWGSNENIDCLHFETCYYSPISWALENGIKRFDPGAGGKHKIRRGFLATPRISMHKWYDKKIEGLIKPWLPKVNTLMSQQINASNNEAPFKYQI